MATKKHTAAPAATVIPPMGVSAQPTSKTVDDIELFVDTIGFLNGLNWAAEDHERMFIDTAIRACVEKVMTEISERLRPAMGGFVGSAA